MWPDNATLHRQAAKMNRQDLRDRQTPLKERYRHDPQAAQVWLAAEGQVDFDQIACRLRQVGGQALPAGNEIVAGLHAATGGADTEVCSGQMLLEALVACSGVTLAAVAAAMRLEIRAATITARGLWDARGTLAVDRAAPVGLTEVELEFHLDSRADDASLDKLTELTERYCVVWQTLAAPPRMSTRRL